MCVRVCPHAYLRNHTLSFTNFSVLVAYSCDSVLWRRCFEDNVVFSYNGPYGGVALQRQALVWPKTLVRIGCFLSYTTLSAKTIDVMRLIRTYPVDGGIPISDSTKQRRVNLAVYI